MWRSLLRSSRGVGRRGDASGGTTSSGPAGIALRVFATEGEPFWTQAKTSHAVRHVFLQRTEETHFLSFGVSFVVFCVNADIDFSSDRMCHRPFPLEFFRS